MAFKMKRFPLIKGTSPAKKYVSDAQRKAVHASKAEKSAVKFNEGLKSAAASGKLDKNPKFKAAVENSPMNRKSFIEKADKKYAKDKDLQRKMTKAQEQGKSKKVERIGKRRTKVQEKAQELDFKAYKAGENSPAKSRKADPASVTRRKNEGDAKGARLERRRGKAAAKGNTSKAKRLARKLKAHDATDNRGKQKARTTEVKKGGRIQF